MSTRYKIHQQLFSIGDDFWIENQEDRGAGGSPLFWGGCPCGGGVVVNGWGTDSCTEPQVRCKRITDGRRAGGSLLWAGGG